MSWSSQVLRTQGFSRDSDQSALASLPTDMTDHSIFLLFFHGQPSRSRDSEAELENIFEDIRAAEDGMISLLKERKNPVAQSKAQSTGTTPRPATPI